MNDGFTPPPPPPPPGFDPTSGQQPSQPPAAAEEAAPNPAPVDPASAPVPAASAPTPPPAAAEEAAPNPAPVDPASVPVPAASAPTPPPAAAAAPAMPNPLQNDDELDESQFITGGDDHSFIKTVPVPPHPNTQFDEQKFLALLAGSISLTKTEKQRIISSIPKLSQYQIDELMRIFSEEQTKFAELNAKHGDKLKELEEKHKNDWDDIATQAKQEEAKKKEDDEAAALRAKLGLK